MPTQIQERLPKDANRIAAQLTPPSPALARTVSSSISASTAVSFNSNTSFLRCYATSQDVYLKWGTTAVTSANFDEILPAGQVVDLFIPFDSSSGALFSSCRVIERTPTASIVIIEK